MSTRLVAPLVAAALVSSSAACSREEGSAASPETWPPRATVFDPHPQDPPATPTPPAYPMPCHAIYAQETFPTFELVMDPGDVSRMRSEAASGIEEWHPATFRYDGEAASAKVRNRGHIKSCGEKLQVAIAFNQDDPEGRFRGLRRIKLDAGHCRILDERLATAFARDAGLPAPCANHARLVINGEYEGLLTNVEAQNKDYLKRFFGPAGDDGDLWKEGSLLKTNEDEPFDDSRLERFRSAEDLETLAALGDLEYNVAEWAMEAALPATDNFWVDGWNYYLYDHPERGFMYLPRDFDKALPWAEMWVDYDPLRTSSHHPITIVLEDPHWKARYVEELRRMIELYDPAIFEERTATWWAQILDAAADDTSLKVDPGDPPPARVRELIPQRIEYLRARIAEVE